MFEAKNIKWPVLDKKIKYYEDKNKQLHKKQLVLLACVACNKQRWVYAGVAKKPAYSNKCQICKNRREYINKRQITIPILPWPILGITKRKHSNGGEREKNVTYLLLKCVSCDKKRWINIGGVRNLKFKNICCSCVNKARPRREYRAKDNNGYIRIRIFPDNLYYSMASKDRKYILEHRYIMAKHLGRSLANNEIVHHKDGIRDNNEIDNLELKMRGEHCKGHEADIYQQKFTNLYHKINQLEKDNIILKNNLKSLWYLILVNFGKISIR